MRVRFAFDFISPYAYLGWKRAQRELPPLGVELEPMPVLFAALLDANQTKGPAEIPSKRIYTWKHVLRLAHELGVPIAPPPAHPFNPLLGLRLASHDLAEPERVRLIDTLFDAAWGGGSGIAEAATVRGLLEGAGLPAEPLLEAAGGEDAKAKVRENTAAALAAGVFGVPSFLVDEEVFWGQDSLPHLAAYLRGEDPVQAVAMQRWADLPSGAQRRGQRS